MPEISTYSPFNYGSLDAQTALFVQQQTSEIKSLFKQTIENIIAIGQRLNQVKDCLPHGQWLDWLAAEFSWTDRTARNYMQVAEEFKLENFTDLNIAASALYLLAAPSTAEEAREEAISRAQAGERITVNAARDLRNKYILPQPKSELESFGVQSEPQPQDLQSELGTQKEQPQSRTQLLNQPSIDYLPRVEPTRKTTAPVKRQRAKEEKPVSVAPKKTSHGTWWRLGEAHLYCGKSSSAEFQKCLPTKVALILMFANSVSEIRPELPIQTASTFCYGSPYGDGRDFRILRELVQNVLELETDGGDTVVMLSLPGQSLGKKLRRYNLSEVKDTPTSLVTLIPNACVSDCQSSVPASLM